MILGDINADESLNMESNEERKSPLSEPDSAKSFNIDRKLCLEPESHLQSLGFTMDNGKPRFKLDEDAHLYSNTALTNFYAPDGDDTLSFVVLSKDSLDSIKQSSLATYVDIQEKCMCIDYNSMIASLDSTEVHQKLMELLQENTKLKETLKQNNIAMKQQFNTLATWQEEIMKVHQNHKEKFAQTRELINYLKKENAELKMRLSSELTSHTELEYEVLNAHDAEESIKGKQLSTSTNEHGISVLHNFETFSNKNADVEAMEKNIAVEYEQKIVQLEKLNAEREQLLEEEKVQLNKEREKLEEEKKVLDGQKKNLEAEYKALNDTMGLLQQERINLQEEKTSLDQQSLLYETHYNNKLEAERKKFETKYGQLNTELGILHESIERKEASVKKLQNELAQHKENIILLETQLRTYEEDFRQERKVKEKLLEQEKVLNTDLQKQIEFNEQLQQEINRLHISSREETDPELVPPRVSLYSCPKCNFTFRSVQSLEHHIDWCIDL